MKAKKVGKKRGRRKTTVHPAMHHLLGKTLHKPGGRKRSRRK